MKRFRPLLRLALCILIVLSLAALRDGRLLGHDLRGESAASAPVANDTVRTLTDGSIIVNTAPLAPSVTGYAGSVPLEVAVKDGVITSVKALPNSETEDFFENASTILSSWNGKTVDEAAALHVDAVSGATYSSHAIIDNMRCAIQYLQKRQLLADKTANSHHPSFDHSPKTLVGLLVALMAALLPLFVKNRRYRLVQHLLNVVVLGFWCGAFLSYTLLIGIASNGFGVVSQAVTIVMLFTAFLYPLFGKRRYYCAHVCPLGSLQLLAGKCVRYRLPLKPVAARRLNVFRQLLWVALMLLIWTGVWADWTNYEPFAAFLFGSASWVAVAIAVAFVLLSLIVPRPYCRFVCPMGTLLHN